MTKRSMDIIGYPEPAIAFVPPLNARFNPIREEIPRLITPEQTDALRRRLEDSVRSACGKTTCKATVSITDRSSLSGNEKVIEAGEIDCTSESCPLRGPDSSGDREPRLPKPPLPALAQELHSEPEEPVIEHERLLDVRS
jgi:hypothetical protein